MIYKKQNDKISIVSTTLETIDIFLQKYYNKRTGGGSNDYSGKIYGQYQRFY